MGAALPRPYVVWGLSRLVILALFIARPLIDTDINYYRASVSGSGGVGRSLAEYPVPAWALIRSVWQVSHHATAFLLGWIGLMLLLDLGFFVVLLRRAVDSAAPRFWIISGLAIGPIIYLRFDLVPAVLVGCACLAAATRPRLAGIAVGVAAWVKYWPAIVLPEVLRMARHRGRVMIALVASVAIIGVLAVLGAGWHRQLTPLTWQRQRGLEFEAIWATPWMILRAFDPRNHVVALSAFNSVDITGRHTSILVTAATLSEIAIGVALAYVWFRRRTDATVQHGVWLVLATISGLIVSDKVFSAQYICWLLPCAAAGLVLADSRHLRRWAALLTVTAALTQLEYPFLAGRGLPIGVSTAVIAVRNLCMVTLFLLALRQAYVADRTAS